MKQFTSCRCIDIFSNVMRSSNENSQKFIIFDLRCACVLYSIYYIEFFLIREKNLVILIETYIVSAHFKSKTNFLLRVVEEI